MDPDTEKLPSGELTVHGLALKITVYVPDPVPRSYPQLDPLQLPVPVTVHVPAIDVPELPDPLADPLPPPEQPASARNNTPSNTPNRVITPP